MAERDRHLDAVKGFAILIVMLGHCIGRNHMNDPYLNDAILTVQMPLFMMVSGYAGGLGKREIATVRDFCHMQKKRALAYLLPFFSWVFVVSIFRTSMQNPFVECYRVLFRIDSGLWFLLTLFLIQCMISVVILLVNAVVTHFHRSKRGLFPAVLFAVLTAIVYLLCLLWARTGATF